MKYRYYLENKTTGNGVTEFSSENITFFIECLIDLINFICYETETAADRKLYVFENDSKTVLTFSKYENSYIINFLFPKQMIYNISLDELTDFIKGVRYGKV